MVHHAGEEIYRMIGCCVIEPYLKHMTPRHQSQLSLLSILPLTPHAVGPLANSLSAKHLLEAKTFPFSSPSL